MAKVAHAHGGYTNGELDELLGSNPKAYQAEVRRLHAEDPERFRTFVAHVRKRLGRDEVTDRPVARAEASDLVATMMAITGWSRARVVAEGMLLFMAQCGSASALPKNYVPCTPADARAKRGRMMTMVEVERLVLGT